MCRLCRLLLTGFFIIQVGWCIPTSGQAKGSGSISGKVTLGGKPAKGVPVSATPSDNSYPPKPGVATSSTDDEGHFRLNGLTAGRYSIAPYQPKEVVPGTTQWETGNKIITLTDGEAVNDVDFTLSRGGVITGRVTGPDGRPMIEQRVTVESAADSKMTFGGTFGSNMYQTDDRGVYRIYGLPAGKYLVSVGDDKNGSSVTYGMGQGGYYARTFHPGVTEKTDAKVVELSEGGEETAVDIMLGRREKSYSISGRMVDEGTGEPAPDVTVGYGKVKPGETSMNGFGTTSKSDGQGQFLIEGVRPGTYAVFAATTFSGGDDNWTSDAIPVEITDADIDGIEIKVRQGIQVDGTVAVEGTSDPAVLSKLQQLTFGAYGQPSGQLAAPMYRNAKVGPDNTLHFNGLSPCKLGIMLSNRPDSPQGFALLRIEQNGVPLPDRSIDLQPGMTSTTVHLVLAYGNGAIRGQVNVVGGTLSPTTRMWASANGPGQGGSSRGGYVDARGHFLIENLPPGEYIVVVLFADVSGSAQSARVEQKTTVSNGNETSITLVLNLAPKNPGGNQQ